MSDQPRPEPPPAIAALTRAFALLGKRWNGLVLAALAKGPAGFGQVRERVPGISDRMLADRLHELATAGLLTRTVHPGPPARSQYALTAHGRAFLIPLAALAYWAEDHLPPYAEQRDERDTGRLPPGETQLSRTP
ncbi:winged helix-turn-helix transcriptional regulator [Streptomyces sp. NBC_01236]|uniref:winged helix-turn-helix transcriptional regulator n=1 Tax=Streptomyces sp. NBC_01236 TaxID=2903789 RepID=UPI002E112599|nr:helix-turn-helix transcriptional regulator [Streptomyces sp. NBC_01236]